MHRITAVVAGLSLAFVGTSATIAGTINVPGDQPTIAAAISASVNGDVINIAAGTYNEYALKTDGKAITIQGTVGTRGSLQTTVKGGQGSGGSVFLCTSGETSDTIIQNLIITDGFVNNDTGSGQPGGGGIYTTSSPTIKNCTITNNTAYYGGGAGVLSHGGNPTIENCSINQNTIIASSLRSNSVGYDLGGGGVAFFGGSGTMSNCTISTNQGYEGGGVYVAYNASPSITGCDITGNSANSQEGGGVYQWSGSSTFTNCTITGNTAGDGGGVNCGSGTIHLVSCNVSSNQSIDQACCDNIEGPGITQTANESGSIADYVIIENCSVFGVDGHIGGTVLHLGFNRIGNLSCSGDTNGDGVIDIQDLLNMLGNWGPCP